MEALDLDFVVRLTREQWQQLGEAANATLDDGVLRWSPDEFDVIRVSLSSTDRPDGWDDVAPPAVTVVPIEREVALFRYNEGRPFGRLEPPPQPATPAITADLEHDMEVELERWVRKKWHQLLCDSGLHYDRNALATDPNAPEP